MGRGRDVLAAWQSIQVSGSTFTTAKFLLGKEVISDCWLCVMTSL